MVNLLQHRFYQLTFPFVFFFVGIFAPVGNFAYAQGPKLSGAMEVFQLAPNTLPRPSPSDDAIWKDAEGKNISLADFKGKVVLLNYWASWCLPCIRELPSIDRLQKKLGGNDFAVVAISIDRGGKTKARKLTKRLKLKHLTLYLDRKSEAAKNMGVRSMPTTFIFDRKGREVGKLVGSAEWDEPDAVRLLKFFIKNPAYVDGLPVKK